VTFYDGVAILGIAALSNTKATLSNTLLPSGTTMLKAYYSGDASYAASSSVPLPHTVTAGVSLGFQNPLKNNTGVQYDSVQVADMNGDGILDLVAPSANGVTVSLGNGDGTFRTVGSPAYGSSAAFAIGDFNGDGRSDVAVVGSHTGVNVFLGNGDGTFQAGVTYATGLAPSQIAAGDFNNDGKADIVVAGFNQNGNGISVLLGNGDGTFAPPVSDLIPSGIDCLATGDFDSDGAADLVITTETGISVLLGHGDGTFAAPVNYTLSQPGPLLVRDLNGDGIADIAVVTNFSTGGVSVLLGNRDGTFQAPLYSSSSAGWLGPIVAEDFNGDGIPDLATNNSLGMGIMLGNGDGSFQPLIRYSGGQYNATAAVGDFNGDGIADVVTADSTSQRYAVYLGGAVPDLSIGVTRYGGLTQGQTGAAYAITVSNVGEIGSSGVVQMAASLPAGFAATSLTGSGWLCTLATGVCKRSDSLAAGASYPPIALKFNVSATLTGAVTATFSVSGGGDRNTANNQASDTPFIRATSATALSTTPNPAVLGHAVTLTAAVTAGATGTVTFYEASTPIGSAALTAGQASLTTSILPSGSQSLHATYEGDANFGPSTSATQTETIVVVQSSGAWSSHSYAAASGATWVVAGDFNGDGVLDLICGGVSNNGVISVLFGKEDGTFGPATTYSVPDVPNSLLAADFNGDGKLDLAVGSGTGLDILLGKGDGTFQPAIQLSPGIAYSSLASADFNGDGIPDLVALNSLTTGVPTLFLGNGDGTFQPAIAIAGGTFDYLSVADVNGDGKTDLILLSIGSGIVGVLPGNGDGTFRSMLTTSLSVGPPTVMTAGDFNGDGRIDVALVSWGGIQTLLGKGDGTFQAPIHSSLSVASAYFAITGDFNGDGKLDIAFTGYAGDSHIHLVFGNGDGTFQNAIPLATDAMPGSIAQGDFNGDGTVDLAVSNYDTGTVDVLLGGELPSLTISASHEGNFTIGSTGSYTLTVSSPAPQSTTATVSVTDTLPTGLAATDIHGSGWSCTLSTLTCTRTDSLASGTSYPTIAIAVNVAATLSPSSLNNQASVRYQSTVSSATDPTTVVWVTTTSLAVSPDPSTLGENVTMTATVTPGAVGTVLFSDSGTFLGVAAIANGQAVFQTNLLPSGRRMLVAAYSGNSTYAKSASARQVQTVNAAVAGGFRAAAAYNSGTTANAVAVGDFNGDGKPDLVTANSVANTVSVLLGNGDGTFAAPVNYAVAQQPIAVAVGDFNNDGKPDLAVVSNYANSVSILLGNGDGTFRAGLSYPAGVPLSVVVADFNTDGNADLAVAADNGAIIFLFGNGDGTFRAGTTTIVTNSTSNLIVGDFNNDGIADLAYAYQGYRLYTLLGNGDGTFRPGIYSSSGSTSGLAAGDLNGDGNTDVVAPTYMGVDVSLGNGDGTFQPNVHYSTATPVTVAILADVNGDGKLDVIAVDNTTGSISVLLGNGDGTLQLPFTYAAGTNPVGIAAGDFNGDGRTDVAVADSQGYGLAVLLGSSNSVLSVTSSHNGLFAPGEVGVTYSLTVTNGGPGATSGAVTVTDSLPSAFAATAISGSGWTCTLSTLTCTRSDVLGVAASYPVITLTVNVVSPGMGIVTNQVSVSGGGAAPASGSDQTGITQGISITVQTNPAGLAFTIDGGPAQIAPQTFVVPEENHVLAVAATQSGAPGVQYVFTGWNDFGAASHPINPVSSPTVYTATFKTQYQLTLAANPGPGGIVTPASGTYYDPGTAVPINAVATSPYIFDGWSGGVTSTNNSLSVTMNGPESLIATFSVPGFTCDLVGNGPPTVADVQLIVNEALGVASTFHDLNRDGAVNVADIQKEMNAALGNGCIY
jgi:uncharacterized repeat protein (TIGR01451 family)